MTVTNYKSCIKIISKNLRHTYLFTNSDEKIIIDNDIYEPSNGIDISAIELINGLAEDNFEIKFTPPQNLLDLILLGLMDDCSVYLKIIDTANILNGIYKTLLSREGMISRFEVNKYDVKAEVLSLKKLFDMAEQEIYSETCRARFGDFKCKVNIEDYTYRSYIAKLTGDSIIVDGTELPKKLVTNNAILEHNGFKYNIKDYISKPNGQIEISIYEHPTFPLKKMDNIKIIMACDKTISTCSKLYDNAINFRGEPIYTR